jgi:Flp pilus assembly protein TadG
MATVNNESGNVVLEFVGTAVALFIPIAYIAVATLQVATGFIEVQNAAKVGARVFVSSPNDQIARSQSLNAINSVLKRYKTICMTIMCSAIPCFVVDSFVTVEVSKQIFLELPTFLGSHKISVSGSQTEVVQESR